jgi:hypothetical protein
MDSVSQDKNMADYDFLNQFLPRLQIYVKEAEIPTPKIQSDGSILWLAAYKALIAVKILEKGSLQTMSMRYDNTWHDIVDNGDPKICYIISPLLSEIKRLAPFVEPAQKEGPVGCRSYKEIFDDLSEEYLKLRKYSKAEAEELAKKLSWSHYKGYLIELIKGASTIDPVRTEEGRHIYGVTYEHLYIKVIEEKGRPAIFKWNDDIIVCQDPRLQEMADEALRAFKARCLPMSKENYNAFHNFIAAYVRIRGQTAQSQPAANNQIADERRIGGDRRLVGDRRLGGDRRVVINIDNSVVHN